MEQCPNGCKNIILESFHNRYFVNGLFWLVNALKVMVNEFENKKYFKNLLLWNEVH